MDEQAWTLKNKTVIVTGASSGLGEATAREVSRLGARVVLAARRVERLERLAAELAGECLVVPTDVADQAQCVALVDAAQAHFGAVHGLVNNAGVGTAVPATQELPADFKRVLGLNLAGAYWVLQAFGRTADPGASAVNVSSIIGLQPLPVPQAAYAASKAGLLGLTRDLAQQWGARRGIRVNAVAPGLIPTEMSDEYAAEIRDLVVKRSALGRLGTAQELASAVAFLLTDAASYITGVTLAVDGGFTYN